MMRPRRSDLRRSARNERVNDKRLETRKKESNRFLERGRNGELASIERRDDLFSLLFFPSLRGIITRDATVTPFLQNFSDNFVDG